MVYGYAAVIPSRGKSSLFSSPLSASKDGRLSNRDRQTDRQTIFRQTDDRTETQTDSVESLCLTLRVMSVPRGLCRFCTSCIILRRFLSGLAGCWLAVLLLAACSMLAGWLGLVRSPSQIQLHARLSTYAPTRLSPPRAAATHISHTHAHVLSTGINTLHVCVPIRVLRTVGLLENRQLWHRWNL